MSERSNSDYLSYIERRRRRAESAAAWNYQPNPVDHMSLKELKQKLLEVTDRTYHNTGRIKQKQLRAEAGSHDLRKWL